MFVLRHDVVHAPVQLFHVPNRKPYQMAMVLVYLCLTTEPATHLNFVLFVVPGLSDARVGYIWKLTEIRDCVLGGILITNCSVRFRFRSVN